MKAPKTWRDLKVGDTVWVFDVNRRVYPKEGGIVRKLIWREHWAPREITGENRASWLIGRFSKLPKKTRPAFGVVITEQELDDACFVNENAHTASDRVRRVRDAATLRAIIALLDGEPE